jgi:cell division protein FtsI/penicillin-binding protein 2
VTPKQANRRIRLLLLAFAIAIAALFGRAVWLQAIRAPSLERLASTQHHATVALPAGRGSILDRAGVPLAMGTQATTVYADPRRIRDPWRVSLAAGKALHVDPDELMRQLADRSRRFVYVDRQADPVGARELQSRRLPGLGFYPEERRAYPQRAAGAHVVGYAGVDNEGLAGIEEQYDGILSGKQGTQTIVREPSGRAVDVVRSVAPREGRDVHLSLDRLIQANTEEVLAATVRRWRARSATAVVLDPRTGGVLAMAVAPRFDANRFGERSPDVTRNRAVTDTYEPGSTFKIVTIAAALAEKVVSPGSSYYLQPSIEVADRVISEDERDEPQQMSVSDIVAESSNVGAVTLALQLGQQRLSRWIHRFGFGSRTGIDFPGETRGIVAPEADWSGSSIGNIPIGHGIGVTPVQVAAAYGVIANRGVWTQPHLALRVEGRSPVKPEQRRVISAGVARQVLDMLRGVVVRGSGAKAAVDGYQVAGKTGTAAKPEGHGYSRKKYVASFAGIVPASRPRLVILVAVDEPHGNIYGGTVAAPAFAEIARFALPYLGIAPDA